MVVDFRFKTVEDDFDLRRLIPFVGSQSLGYKDYYDWVKRTELEIELGTKKAIMVLYEDNKVIADIIFQRHKEIPWVREPKNLRVENHRNMGIARYLMKLMEIENPGDYEILMVDVRPTELAVTGLLLSLDYKLIKVSNLYDPNIEDMIFAKVKKGSKLIIN